MASFTGTCGKVAILGLLFQAGELGATIRPGFYGAPSLRILYIAPLFILTLLSSSTIGQASPSSHISGQPAVCERPLPSKFTLITPSSEKPLLSDTPIEFAILIRGAIVEGPPMNGYQLLDVVTADGAETRLHLHQVAPDGLIPINGYDTIFLSDPITLKITGPLILRAKYAIGNAGPCGIERTMDIETLTVG
jgi:hypothetical protein